MQLKDRIKLSLDTTILQSNTGIDLIAYIKRQRNIILGFVEKYENEETMKEKDKVLKSKDLEIISEAFERLLKEHTEALHRRIGRIKYDKSFVDQDEPDPYEGIARIVRVDKDGNDVSGSEEGYQ